MGLFVQDTITKGSWSFNVGIRGDIYRGISNSAQQAEPRAGIAYNIKRHQYRLRVSYARVMETPFNENLVLASTVGNPVAEALFGATSPILPGQRNEFHAGFQQAFGKYLVVDADYLWKYTHNAYDFSDFLNTPIFFPIAWHNSKIHGPSVRVSLPNFHGVDGVFHRQQRRCALLQSAGRRPGHRSELVSGPFASITIREFQQTTHVQYQPYKNLPWIALNWRYDNGLVAERSAVFQRHKSEYGLCGNFVHASVASRSWISAV